MKEVEQRGRVGGIVDRRFGENDPSMPLEERMLERFTRERQRVSKASAFNLENEDELTHYGQSLSKLDDFDDVLLPVEEDEDGKYRPTFENRVESPRKINSITIPSKTFTLVGLTTRKWRTRYSIVTS